MYKENFHVIGVMSGTSLDGIDLAEIIFDLSEDYKWSFTIVSSETIAYSNVWKQRLKEGIHLSEEALKLLNEEYTNLLSEVIKTFITKNKITELDAVCSHGHTILHQPQKGITLQIGNLPKLTNTINQTVVCDFRVQDVEMGGQGAPLVPIGDRLLFGDYDYCLNLGGFANVSSEKDGERIAYDICPVNIVLNDLAEKLGFPYDDRGTLAKNGDVNLKVLKKLGGLEFYKLLPPKSLGLEWVQQRIWPILNASNISEKDKLRTMTDHIAEQIAMQFKKDASVLVTGGGAYNNYLISKIKSLSKVQLIVPSEDIIENKEALIFGLLGVLKLRGEVNCLASVTGAERDHSSGTIFIKN